MRTPRLAKRVPQSCYDCYKRRVKCNRQIPCDVCIKRGHGDQCHREPVVVKGIVHNVDTDKGNYDYSRKFLNLLKKEKIKVSDIYGILEENLRLKQEVNMLKRENDVQSTQVESYKGSNEDRLDGKMTPIETKNSIYQHYGSKIPEKTNVYGFYGESLGIISRRVPPRNHQSQYPYKNFDILFEILTQENSEKLIKFSLDYLIIFHSVVISSIFLQEHDHFFLIGGDHLNSNVGKTRDQYLWLSIYYAMICNSFSTLDETLIRELDITEDLSIELSQISGHASLECLHRGQYLLYPDIKSLQAFCVLCTSFYSVVGAHVQDSLLGSMTYIARALNLHKLTKPTDKIDLLNFELNCRIWWVVTVIDWFEDRIADRATVIDDSFTTPLPRNISDENLINSIEQESSEFLPITYNLFMFELSSFKRKYYYKRGINYSSPKDMEDYQIAYSKIIDLEKSIANYKEPNTPFHQYSRFILNVKLENEKILVFRQIIDYKLRMNEPIENEKIQSTDISIRLLELFNSPLPFFYKKYWLVGEHCLTGAVFLIITMIRDTINMTHLQHIQQFIKNLELLLVVGYNAFYEVVPILKKLMQVVAQKFRNESYSLEIKEIMTILDTLDNIPKVYETLDDGHWDEILHWIHAAVDV